MLTSGSSEDGAQTGKGLFSILLSSFAGSEDCNFKFVTPSGLKAMHVAPHPFPTPTIHFEPYFYDLF